MRHTAKKPVKNSKRIRLKAYPMSHALECLLDVNDPIPKKCINAAYEIDIVPL